MPVLGGGDTNKPKMMFVFINPTIRNISSDKGWKGPRFPFIGTKNIWKVFNKAGLLSDELLAEIMDKSPRWSVDLAKAVLKSLKGRKIYLTNIVKWTGPDAALPNAEKIRLFLPVLHNEIELIKPQYIVAFGLLPFEGLTRKKIKLSEYYNRISKKHVLAVYPIQVGNFRTNVIPCYFPVGRGRPKQAIELLRLANDL